MGLINVFFQFRMDFFFKEQTPIYFQKTQNTRIWKKQKTQVGWVFNKTVSSQSFLSFDLFCDFPLSNDVEQVTSLHHRGGSKGGDLGDRPP